MKRILTILLAVCMTASIFVACSSANKDADKSTTKADENAVATTETITTDDAKIAEADAINLIRVQYTAKELGLSQKDYEDSSFMVSTSGIEYDGAYYVKVIAAVKVAHKAEDGGETTYTFDTKGEYLISYDGKTILKKDMTSEEEKYDKMEVREVPENVTAATHESEEAETEKKAE